MISESFVFARNKTLRKKENYYHFGLLSRLLRHVHTYLHNKALYSRHLSHFFDQFILKKRFPKGDSLYLSISIR